MTSEVAVMNRLAVALAADSAVTVSDGRQNKVYNTANKLFMLSRRHPVGVMVYNNGSLLGVPWETLVKAYRDKLADDECDTLEEYATRFLQFLEKQTGLFTRELQSKYFLALVEAFFDGIAREIHHRINVAEERLHDAARKSEREKIVLGTIREIHERWKELEPIKTIATGIGEKLAGSHSAEIAQLTTKYFRSKLWVVEQSEVRLLRELATFLVDKAEIPEPSLSGIVVAGFGKNDFFPVLKEYEVGELYDDRLKYLEKAVVRVTDKEPSHVKVFAESDMARVFLHGISDHVERLVIERAFDLTENLIEEAVSQIDNPGTHSVELSRLEAARDKLLEGLVDEIEQYKDSQKEFDDALVHLPKDELASVAASLVNLNSFKKRMSLSLETVGGPVDVAVISKGDGFIWIDRKHYFNAEKNPHYFKDRHGVKLEGR